MSALSNASEHVALVPLFPPAFGTSQSCPDHTMGHMQVNVFPDAAHVPPFWQVVSSHIPICDPMKMALLLHWNTDPAVNSSVAPQSSSSLSQHCMSYVVALVRICLETVLPPSTTTAQLPTSSPTLTMVCWLLSLSSLRSTMPQLVALAPRWQSSS